MLRMIDIGSSGGIEKRFLNLNIGDVLRFDPFESESDSSIPKCAFDSDGTAKFYVLRKRDCSSLYEPNYEAIKSHFGKVSKKYLIDKVIEVETTRIEKYIDGYDFMKIDAQGAELAILQGAGKELRKLSAIVVEAYLFPFYKKAPLFKKVNRFLRESGFTRLGYLRVENRNLNDFAYVRGKKGKSMLRGLRIRGK